ncbi:hypothetical protein ABIB85_006343 [Bradyrhizobium sp. JR1.5]
MHRLHDMELSEAAICDFSLMKVPRNYADNLSAGCNCCIGYGSHQTNVSSACNKADLVLGQESCA